MLVEEADELGAGVRPAGIGVGPVRDTSGPAMPALVDGPALGESLPAGAAIRGAGVGMPAGHLAAVGLRGGRRGWATVRALRRQDVVDEGRGGGVGPGGIPVAMKDDQRRGARGGVGGA